MTNIVKENLHASIAATLYREIMSRSSKYFYYLGGTTDEDVLGVNNSIASEHAVRNNIVMLKAVNPTDVAMVIPRINWTSGISYDQFDDRYSTQVIGINIVNAGKFYNTAPTVEITGGGGSGAAAVAVLNLDGSIKEINMTNGGTGYTTAPTINFSGAVIGFGGEPAEATAVLAKTVEGFSNIEDARFYVLTNDNRVYKCIDNNNGEPSTVKPTSIGPDVFKTEDNYSWKFLFRIPPNMVNKFLTPEFMPVINALSDNFYDLGAIGRLNIESSGIGYDYSTTKIEVNGDGFLKTNPFLLTGISVVEGGSLYGASPTIVFDSPIDGDYKNYVVGNDTIVNRGEFVKDGNRFFEVIKGGTLISAISSVSDPHNPITCDDTVLQFVGETVQGSVSSTSGVITGASLLGKVFELDILNGGSGYPDGQIVINVKDGATTVVFASGICENGKLQNVKILSSGNYYTTLPALTYIVGIAWVANTSVPVNTVVSYNENIYLRVSDDPAGSTPPTHLDGTVGVWKYLGKQAKVQAKLSYGYGYTETPQYTVTGGAGSGALLNISGEKSNAKILPVIENGNIVDYIILDGGIGYTYANVSVVSASGNGAKISANVFVGSIDTLEANNILSNVVGGIHNIKVVSGGQGYSDTDLPIVTITGDGEGAKALPVIEGGRVVRFNITDSGKNYTYATVSLSTASGIPGTGASGRAIITPYGGHGRDNMKELFARRVETYAKLQGEKFSGFSISNDYRIYGLIKNPKNFEDSAYISSAIATSCYIVYCSFDSTKFIKDAIINVTGKPTKRFKIIDTVDGAMIIQDLDNYKLIAGEQLEITIGSTTTKTEVQDLVLPSFGKYTGDILNIDHRPVGFTSTLDQSIVIRTILGWDA